VEGEAASIPRPLPLPRFGGPPPDVVAAADLSYASFVARYLAPGRPVIITGVTAGWGAPTALLTPAGAPDPAALAALAPPDARFPVAEPGGGRVRMTAAEYAAYWAAHAAGEDDRCLYLKDAHVVLALPAGASLYAVPPWFADDWLNGACDDGWTGDGEVGRGRGRGEDAGGGAGSPPPPAPPPDDYRFLYLGPASTATGLHTDVLGSASWSATVAGVKRWRLLPPRAARLAHDRFGHGLAPSLDAPPSPVFPWLADAAAAACEVEQPPGSAMFVPPGWHHTVENLTDCLSINHNWVNAHTLAWTVGALVRERGAAEAAIEDCR
jgi:hypothetical protein